MTTAVVGPVLIVAAFLLGFAPRITIACVVLAACVAALF